MSIVGKVRNVGSISLPFKNYRDIARYCVCNLFEKQEFMRKGLRMIIYVHMQYY